MDSGDRVRQAAVRSISYGAVLPVPPDQAFAVVSEPTRWPGFFEGMASAERDDDWGRPGARGRMVNRFLGATVRTSIEILEWEPGRRFRFRGRQDGRPDTDNLRLFEPVEGGTRLRGTTTITLRPGFPGLLDRISLRVLQRVYDRAMSRLPDVVHD